MLRIKYLAKRAYIGQVFEMKRCIWSHHHVEQGEEKEEQKGVVEAGILAERDDLVYCRKETAEKIGVISYL